MFWRQKTSHPRITDFVGLVTLICLSAGYYLGWHRWADNQITHHQLEIDRISKLVEQVDDLRSHIKELQTQISLLREHSDDIRTRIPMKPNEAELWEEIAQAASTSGLKVSDYQRGRVSNLNAYSQFEVLIEAEGSYVEICNFFKNIRGLRRLTTTTNLSISNLSVTDKRYEVETTLVVFFNVRPPDRDAKSTTLAREV